MPCPAAAVGGHGIPQPFSDSLKLSRSRTVGVEGAGLWAMAQVEFVAMLETLGLVLDGSGFVRRTEVFDGNVVEGTTLAGMLQRLRAPAAALVVMDRGIATDENLLWLCEQGYRYLMVSHERQRQLDPNEASDLQTASGECVSVQRIEDAEGQEVRLNCYRRLVDLLAIHRGVSMLAHVDTSNSSDLPGKYTTCLPGAEGPRFLRTLRPPPLINS